LMATGRPSHGANCEAPAAQRETATAAQGDRAGPFAGGGLLESAQSRLRADLEGAEAAAQPLGMELQRLEVRVPEDFAGAFQAASRQRAGALIAPGHPPVTN